MKLSTYLIITKLPEVANLLKNYISPRGECSIAKGIPYTVENIKLIHKLGKVVPLDIRYRGPIRSQLRRIERQSTCLKKDAATCTIYVRSTGYSKGPTPTNLLKYLWIPEITEFDIGKQVDDIMNKYVGTGDLISAQDELIDAGFIEQAKL